MRRERTSQTAGVSELTARSTRSDCELAGQRRDRVLTPHSQVGSARRDGGRVEKTTHIEVEDIRLNDGTTTRVSLYAIGGALGIGRLDDTGHLHIDELRRVRTHRNVDKSGRYRRYNDYKLPSYLGSGTLTVRLHGTPADDTRGLNRTENLRPIPPSDPDFTRLFRRRNDAESINRALDEGPLPRPGPRLGNARQLLNPIGFAVIVNSLAIARHIRSRPPLAAAA